MLLHQSYFDKHLKPIVSPSSGEKREAHSLFRLTTANDGQMPDSIYIDMDVNFLGLNVPDVGILITKDPSYILDDTHQTWMPTVVAWNLIRLSFNAFVTNHLTAVFKCFQCPPGLNPLISPNCVYYYTDVCKTLGIRVGHKSHVDESSKSTG